MQEQGLLQWQISVRDDGCRLLQGCLPTLIQWGNVHPSASMAQSGVVLREFSVQHPQADLLSLALQDAGLERVPVSCGAMTLNVVLQTPRGEVVLSS